MNSNALCKNIIEAFQTGAPYGPTAQELSLCSHMGHSSNQRRKDVCYALYYRCSIARIVAPGVCFVVHNGRVNSYSPRRRNRACIGASD